MSNLASAHLLRDCVFRNCQLIETKVVIHYTDMSVIVHEATRNYIPKERNKGQAVLCNTYVAQAVIIVATCILQMISREFCEDGSMNH